jgi:WD40 repeat protein
MAQREVLAIGVPSASGNPPTMHVNDAMLNRDGSRLLVGTADGSVALWDIATAKQGMNWKIAIMPVKRVFFGNEGNQAWAVAGPNVHGVELESGNSRVEVTADADIVDIRIDEGRRRILTVDGKHTARLWTWEGGTYRAHPPVRLFEGLLDYHAFSGDSQFVVSGGSRTNEIVIANLLTGTMPAHHIA